MAPNVPRSPDDDDDKAFDPGMTSVVIQAFDEAWKSLESNSEFAQPLRAARTRDLLARRVIEMARRGEADPDRLRADALEFLRQQSRSLGCDFDDDPQQKAPSSETWNRKAQEYMQLLEHAVTAAERQHLIKLTSYWFDLAQKAILRREAGSPDSTD